MQKKIVFTHFLILFILIISAYSNTFYSTPILDDYHSFIEDECVYIKQISVSSLISLSNTKFGWSRWIPMVTFAIDHYMGKGAIFNFHLTNFSIHIFCTLAVMLLVAQLMKSNRESEGFERIIPPMLFALWVSGLWALNPVQTNAVTYLVQRMASIQTFFYVLSVSFYILARRTHLFHNDRFKAIVFYTSSLFVAICAFLSKQNAAMLPVMLVVTEVWFFQPQLFPSLWAKIRNSNGLIWGIFVLGFFLGAMLAVKIFFILQAGYATRSFTMWERLLTEGRVVVWYLTLLIWPSPSRLSIEHEVEISTSLLSPPTTLLSIVFLFFIFCLVLKSRRKFPLLSYGGMWFFLNLAIESTIINLEIIFEHRLYLPSIGFYLFVVVALVEISRSLLHKMSERDFKKIAWSGFAIVAACYSLLTFQRNEAWRDFLTFNEDVVSKSPSNSRAHANLAVALAKAQRYEEAIKEAETTIELGSKHEEQYIVAANVIVGSLIGMGDVQKAADRGQELLTHRPEPCDAVALPNFCLQIAEAHRRMGDLRKACSYTLLCLEYGQKLGGLGYEKRLAEGMLASILTTAKEMDLDLNEDGLADPGSLPLNTWIAKEFLRLDGREEAKRLLLAASMDNPDDPETRSLLDSLVDEDNRSQIQTYKGSFSDKYVKSPFSRFNASMALAYLIREHRLPSHLLKIGENLANYAVYLKPYAPDAHLLKGWYHFEKEEADQAVECARRALELDPQYAKAYLGLGFFLLRANAPQEAISAFQKTLELFPRYPRKKALLDIIAEIRQGCPDMNVQISGLKN